MKNNTAIILSFLIISISTGLLYSKDGKPVGKIGSVNSGGSEIVINLEEGNSIRMGEMLYVRAGDDIIVMEATFPMMTTVKTRIVRKYAGSVKSVSKGMAVYRYDRTIAEDGSTASTIVTGKIETVSGSEMVFISGGDFMMGSTLKDNGAQSCETRHKVKVSSFWMGKYEVTQKLYRDITGSASGATAGNYGEGDSYPAYGISWYDAVEFCNMISVKAGLKPYYKIDKTKKDKNNKRSDDNLKYTVTVAGGNGFRLPTEAEWEFACRAGTETIFSYGPEINSGNVNHDGRETGGWVKSGYRKSSTKAGSFKPNAWGLYDMHGNVWEWCFDWYSCAYPVMKNQSDPKGPVSGEQRVRRGGCWDSRWSSVRSAARGYDPANVKLFYQGFRVARSM